mmetsp:Transcript_74247/g.193339  ORF Transcript_74247/g.193339 Transcript_74247/m.193339 type:complete len:203 (+) Transcript_74247:737-1345(+)
MVVQGGELPGRGPPLRSYVRLVDALQAPLAQGLQELVVEQVSSLQEAKRLKGVCHLLNVLPGLERPGSLQELLQAEHLVGRPRELQQWEGLQVLQQFLRGHGRHLEAGMAVELCEQRRGAGLHGAQGSCHATQVAQPEVLQLLLNRAHQLRDHRRVAQAVARQRLQCQRQLLSIHRPGETDDRVEELHVQRPRPEAVRLVHR